jgi:hypothetical protein
VQWREGYFRQGGGNFAALADTCNALEWMVISDGTKLPIGSREFGAS